MPSDAQLASTSRPAIDFPANPNPDPSLNDPNQAQPCDAGYYPLHHAQALPPPAVQTFGVDASNSGYQDFQSVAANQTAAANHFTDSVVNDRRNSDLVYPSPNYTPPAAAQPAPHSDFDYVFPTNPTNNIQNDIHNDAPVVLGLHHESANQHAQNDYGTYREVHPHQNPDFHNWQAFPAWMPPGLGLGLPPKQSNFIAEARLSESASASVSPVSPSKMPPPSISRATRRSFTGSGSEFSKAHSRTASATTTSSSASSSSTANMTRMPATPSNAGMGLNLDFQAYPDQANFYSSTETDSGADVVDQKDLTSSNNITVGAPNNLSQSRDQPLAGQTRTQLTNLTRCSVQRSNTEPIQITWVEPGTSLNFKGSSFKHPEANESVS